MQVHNLTDPSITELLSLAETLKPIVKLEKYDPNRTNTKWRNVLKYLLWCCITSLFLVLWHTVMWRKPDSRREDRKRGSLWWIHCSWKWWSGVCVQKMLNFSRIISYLFDILFINSLYFIQYILPVLFSSFAWEAGYRLLFWIVIHTVLLRYLLLTLTHITN